MATDRIITAPEHKKLIVDLSRKLTGSAGGGKDYIIGRIAIARSLIFPELDYDKSALKIGKGKEYPRHALLGGELKESMFKALIVQRHQKNFESDDEFMKAVKFHLDRGLTLIENEIQNYHDVWDYLTDLLQNGIEQATLTEKIDNKYEYESGFSNVLKIIFGTTNEEQVEIEFNRHQNTHLGIAGKAGSGKTQFVLDLLYQIRTNSQEKINFIFIDYKGDVSKNEKFIKATNSKVIDVEKTPLPFNPFWIADTEDNRNLKREISHHVEMIANIEKGIGIKQKGVIYDAVFDAFQSVKNSANPVPDIYDIRQSLENLYDKSDSATEIFRNLTNHEIFAKKTDADNLQTLYNNSLIFDIKSIKSQKNLIVFFILEYLKRELMELPEQIMYDDIRELRTIIVIDEAHYFLRDKKMCSILDDILRVVRSKGVSVFLLTQSPDDFSETEDFLVNLEFIIALKSMATSQFLQKTFSISLPESRKLAIDIGNLQVGFGYIKDFETHKATQLKLKQFWKRSTQ